MDGQGTGPSPAARKIVEIVNLSDILINGKGVHMNPPTAEAKIFPAGVVFAKTLFWLVLMYTYMNHIFDQTNAKPVCNKFP